MSSMLRASRRRNVAVRGAAGFLQGAQFGLYRARADCTSRDREVILDEIGSYGRQIGRIGDTIEVLLKQLNRSRLSDAKKEVIAVFEGQLAQARSIKRSTAIHSRLNFFIGVRAALRRHREPHPGRFRAAGWLWVLGSLLPLPHPSQRFVRGSLSLVATFATTRRLHRRQPR